MIPSLLKPHPEVWVYLAASPLSWLTLTLMAYLVADRISIACNRHPAANLVALAAILIILALKATGTSYETYFAGAQFIHFLLGPATVALAVPLYRNFERVRATALPIAASLGVGSLVAIVSAVGIAQGSRRARMKSWRRWRRNRSPPRSPWALPKNSAARPSSPPPW